MRAQLFWGIFFWLGISEFASAAILVELRDKAEQNTIALPLAAVINVSGAKESEGALFRVALPAKGRVGDTVTYTRSEITQFIGATHPEWSKLLRWSGADRVLVQRRGITLPADEYIGWARERLQERWSTKNGRFELKPISEYRPIMIPVGACSVVARFDGDAVRRTTKVWLDIAVDSQHYTTVVVAFDVRWLHPALVLKQRGSARQKLSAAMVTSTEANISLTNGAVVEDMQQLIGKRLRHDVEAGVPLAAGDVEVKPTIESGDAVQVYAKVGRVMVQSRAIAQRDGNTGQKIDVKNTKTNEQLTVEVIGENRAIVSENQNH